MKTPTRKLQIAVQRASDTGLRSNTYVAEYDADLGAVAWYDSSTRLWTAYAVSMRDGKPHGQLTDALYSPVWWEALEDMDRSIGAALKQRPPVHTRGGVVIGSPDLPTVSYGMTHDSNCPGCVDTPFTLSPRSETYWSS